MLIHIGQNEFVHFMKCELIINLHTVDEHTRKKVLSELPKLDGDGEYRAAIKTVDGKWFGSTLTPEALAQRCMCHQLPLSVYVKPDWNMRSHYRY